MDVERFTRDPEVLRHLDGLRRDCANKEFSDVVDGEGCQYVVLVMEGGGVLGVALVGYTYVLEQMGVRFLRIGGASAGAINALLMAALDVPSEPKSEEAVRLLAALDLDKFVDGGRDARDFLDAMRLGGGWMSVPRQLWEGAQVLDDLWRDFGLNPGEEFRRWLSGVLADAGVPSAHDLGRRMRELPRSLQRRDKPEEPTLERDGFRLALVAADISTQTKVEFPKMAPLYWRDPDGVDPAFFVRASMSIPYFFHPFRRARKDMPSWETMRDEWERLAGYRAELPEECIFVDGGIMSNFPIDLFHKTHGEPAAPTFGAKLGQDERRGEIGDLKGYTWAIFDSARHCLDYDFIFRNPDYKRLLTYIDVRDYDWLDFGMSEETRLGLFRRGVEAAATFLRAFDWKGYKEIRSKTAEVAETAKAVEARTDGGPGAPARPPR